MNLTELQKKFLLKVETLEDRKQFKKMFKKANKKKQKIDSKRILTELFKSELTNPDLLVKHDKIS
jgi:mRNA-degrading endonuclease YafQ of YafQ-DinJ toxin-antitoxin module